MHIENKKTKNRKKKQRKTANKKVYNEMQSSSDAFVIPCN